MISLLVAYAKNGVIGKQNDLPWYLPADLKRFKQLTVGHPVIVGRKTFDSITKRLGHSLPDRPNIVLTRDSQYQYEGAKVVSGMEEALAATDASEEVFVIGGAEIYRQALPVAGRIYATEVKAEIDGDVFFPEFDRKSWREVERQTNTADEKNPYDYDFVVYERMP